MGFGQSKMTLDLMDVKDWNEIVAMVAAAAKQAKPGEWIIGRGWHQEKWAQRPAAERRRLSVSRRAEQGVAEQSGDAHARQRPRELRQCQGDGGGGPDREDARSGGRRDSQGQARAGRSACCAKPHREWSAARSSMAREEDARGALADARRQIELAVQASARKRRHQLSRRRRELRHARFTSRRPPKAAWACGCG